MHSKLPGTNQAGTRPTGSVQRNLDSLAAGISSMTHPCHDCCIKQKQWRDRKTPAVASCSLIKFGIVTAVTVTLPKVCGNMRLAPIGEANRGSSLPLAVWKPKEPES